MAWLTVVAWNFGGVMASLTMGLSNMAKSGQSVDKAFIGVIDRIAKAKDNTAALNIAVETFGSRGGAVFAEAVRSGRLTVDQLTTTIDGARWAIMRTAWETADFAEKFTILKNKAFVALEPIASKVFDLANVLTEKAIRGVERRRQPLQPADRLFRPDIGQGECLVG